jgi:DNA-binding NtrC family response regulator
MVGDTAQRTFSGKLIAATNRDLTTEMRNGRFREDLYYRLCADLIRTPSLKEQVDDSPQVLDDLVLFMVRRSVGEEAERCYPEVKAWIAKHLPPDYRWPGNYRELEQCIRNVIIRRTSRPVTLEATGRDPYMERIMNGQLTIEELTSYYAALVYQKAGSYEDAARRLGMDRRTVKVKIEKFLKRATGAAMRGDPLPLVE